jgi:hypothetical protein
MVHGVKKPLSFWTAAGIIALSMVAVTTFGAESGDKPLQPQGLNYSGIYELRRINPDLTGKGVKFAVVSRSINYTNGEPQNDYQPNTKHNCFNGKKFTFHDQNELPAGLSAHSTAMCSILLGEDPNALNSQLGGFYYQGTAPHGEADVYEFWHFLINNVFSQSLPQADILVAGIGSQFEDWWTRGIDSMAEHDGLIVVAGIGNGLDSHDPVLYPGACANVIGVGVIDSVNVENPALNLANFSLAYPEHSSFGPTGDGRCKPDIIAPGNCLAADANELNKYEPTGSWSSFSTPIVAGTIGLLVQKAKEDSNLSTVVSPQAGGCVIKAILLNSAKKLPFWHKGQLEAADDHEVPLDYIQGAGVLNAVGAYQHLIAGRGEPNNVPVTGWDFNLLQANSNTKNIYKIKITQPQDKFITATLVWNKHYNSVYPFEPIVENDADLKLELVAVDPNDPNNSITIDYSDSGSDNLEHVYYTLTDANYSDYEIIISLNDSNDPNQKNITQNYGLAWNVSKRLSQDNILWYDLNTDGIVNDSDFTILVNNVLTGLEKNEGYLYGDINSDGAIDVKDVQLLLNHLNLKADWHSN